LFCFVELAHITGHIWLRSCFSEGVASLDIAGAERFLQMMI